MFDTINGLPVHALVVHGVVVLLPLMSLVTIAVAFRPTWRAVATPWVAALDAAVFGLAWVAKESGEQLQARLGGEIAEHHAELGDLLPWFALGLFAASVLLWFTVRRRTVLLPLALAAVVIAGLAAIGWTVWVGDTGARSVWEDVVTNTSAPN
jgi:hypothetical protein